MKYEIDIKRSESSKFKDFDINEASFGKVYSDHMFVAEYENGEWKNFCIKPFGPISLTPANLTLHYGQSIFEGMKASKDTEGNPMLFRLDRHIKRLNESAERMGMPSVPEDMFVQALELLVSIDYQWIPDAPNALYIRPFMFAADEFIGVRSSDTFKFIIFTGPVSNYYKKPVKLLTAQKYIRAAKGGVGFAKTAGNYAATLYPMNIASKMGYDQIMWMSPDFEYIQECGTMNLFFVIDGRVITPTTIDGTILEGITRDSFIKLLKEKGIAVEERHVNIKEIVEAHEQGRLEDVFGAGTAAVVAPVSELTYRDKMMKLPPIEGRTISKFLKDELNNIRSGASEDRFNWVHKVNIHEHV